MGEVQALARQWQALDLRANLPDVSAYPVPQVVSAGEIRDGLYNSQRDELELTAPVSGAVSLLSWTL